MEYTGNCKKVYCKEFKNDVFVLEYKSKDKYPYCNCDRCGKPIKNKMYVIQDKDTDLEMMYLGSECLKYYL